MSTAFWNRQTREDFSLLPVMHVKIVSDSQISSSFRFLENSFYSDILDTVVFHELNSQYSTADDAEGNKIMNTVSISQA